MQRNKLGYRLDKSYGMGVFITIVKYKKNPFWEKKKKDEMCEASVVGTLCYYSRGLSEQTVVSLPCSSLI